MPGDPSALSRLSLDLIWAATNEAIAISDEHGVVLAANPACFRLFGHSPETIIGRSFALIFPEEQRAEAEAQYREIFATGAPGRVYEAAFIGADGDHHVIESRIDFVVEGGRRTAMIAITRDISKRCDRESRLRLLEAAAQHAREPIVVTDADLDLPGPRIIYVNPAFEAMYGYTLEEVRGKTPRTLQGPKSDRATLARLREQLSRGEVFVGETTNYSKDGRPYIVEWSAAPVRDNFGRVTHFVGVQRDITERRKVEERLLETQKLESLGALAGGIAHDFNNLLMAVLGNVDLALAQLPDASPVRTSVTQIGVAARRAADLTGQMLAYAGKGRFVMELVNLNEVIVEMAHLLKTSTNRAASLSFRLGARIPPVEADVTQIRQLAMNLVTNAAEAVEDVGGSIHLTTTVRQVERDELATCVVGADLPPGRHVVLEIADNGRGMDAETRARVFDPFFTTKFTGRGLGLAAVHGIVRGHGGGLRIQSAPGEGTTISVYLRPMGEGDARRDEPRARRDGRQAASAAGQPPARAAHAQPSGLAVLVIDDDTIVREAARRMVELLGHSALAAADGQEGLALFRAHRATIGCVLLDLLMPGMSGEATLKELQAIDSDVPILLISGYNAEEINRRMEGRGLAGFIQKPFTLQQLQAALTLVLA